MLTTIKKKLKFFLRIFFSFINLEWMFSINSKILFYSARLIFFKDWILNKDGFPQFYKQQLNLYQWIYNPECWSFVARGFYPREEMFPNCKILDLCCGDGTYSLLFYANIAGQIDAVDKDPKAIRYAKKYSSYKNISYHQLDVISENLPSSNYDFIIWNAAISYFDEREIDIILKKIINVGTKTMHLFGMTPIENKYVDHKKEFKDKEELLIFLEKYFVNVKIKVLNHGKPGYHLYFHAFNPQLIIN